MKKLFKTFLAVAMLAVGGFNVYTAMDGDIYNGAELKLENIEAFGQTEFSVWRDGVLYFLGLQGTSWTTHARYTYEFPNYVLVDTYEWCVDDGTYTPKCEIGTRRMSEIKVY